MLGAGTIIIGTLAIGGAYLFARTVAWSDARPPMAVFGDVVELPAEAKRPGGIGSGGGRSKTHRVETHGGTHTTRRPGEAE
jgi:hypothetical protein